MRSKTSLFNRTLFFDILKRFWPLYAAFPVACIFLLPVNLNSSLSMSRAAGDLTVDGAYSAINIICGSTEFFAPVLAAVFSVAFAMAAFYGLYTGRSVSALCSLPIKREGLFLSMYLPGIVVMLVSDVLTLLITFAVLGSYGLAGVCASALFKWFGIVVLEELFFLGFAALCGAMTGHILVLPAVYIVLNFTWVVVCFALSYIEQCFIYGLSASIGWDGAVSYLFSPMVFMLAVVPGVDYFGTGYPVTMEYAGWLYISLCAVAGILLLLGAMYLVKIRRMETAGDVVAFKPLKPLFKYCMTFGSALVIGILLFTSLAGGGITRPTGAADPGLLVVCMLVGAFSGYFIAEMLIKKNFRVFGLSNWKGMAISWAVVVALALFLRFDVLGIEKRVPDPESVVSVDVMGSFDAAFGVDDPESIARVIQLHSSIIGSRDKYANTRDDEGTVTLRLRYHLKGGGSLDRDYTIPMEGGEEDVLAIEDFLNSPGMIKYRKMGSLLTEGEWTISDGNVSFYSTELSAFGNKTLTAEQARHLYEDGIAPDMEEGTIGLVWLHTQRDDEFDDLYMACEINISFVRYREHVTSSGTELGRESQGFGTTVTVNSAHTLAVLKELGIEPLTYTETHEESGEYTKDIPVDEPAIPTHSRKDIVLPAAEDVSKVSVTDGDSPVVSTEDPELIARLLEAMGNAKDTGKESVSDEPEGDIAKLITLSHKSGGESRMYMYYWNGELVLEQPYTGIFSVDPAVADIVGEIG